MAIDVCSEIPTTATGISPRVSFSHDLRTTDDQNDVASSPTEEHRRDRSDSDLCLLDSSSDFVFCITNSFSHKLSSADELFSNGKIVPTNPLLDSSQSHHTRSQPSSIIPEKKRLKEFLLVADEEDDNEEDEEEEEEEEEASSRSFWQFKRSSSLNCDTTTHGRSVIRSLLLSRSNSTGSVLNPKHSEIPKEIQKKQRLQKQSSVSSRRSSSSSSSSSSTSTYYFYNSSQKPSLKFKNGGSYGNGVRISPVLNLPQAYMPKTSANFFGFGSLFCNGKIKRKKKKK